MREEVDDECAGWRVPARRLPVEDFRKRGRIGRRERLGGRDHRRRFDLRLSGAVGVVGANTRKANGVKVNYQSIGSGGGISQVKAGTVNFGASDKPPAPR